MTLTRRWTLLAAAALLAAASVRSAPTTAGTPRLGSSESDSCTGVVELQPRWPLSPSTDGYDAGGAVQRFDLTGSCTENEQYHSFWWRASGAGGAGDAHIVYETEMCGTPLYRDQGLRFGSPPVGRLSFVGTGESQCDGSAIATNTPTMDVRAKSWGYLAAKRSGQKVHLTVRGMRYWTSTQANGDWAGASGVIQYRDAGSSEWKSLKNVSTDNAGHDSYVYTTSATRSYRVLFPNDTYVWGAMSEASGTA